jgi:hypothetical protein
MRGQGGLMERAGEQAFLFFNWYAFVMASLTLNECWAAMSSTSEQQARRPGSARARADEICIS